MHDKSGKPSIALFRARRILLIGAVAVLSFGGVVLWRAMTQPCVKLGAAQTLPDNSVTKFDCVPVYVVHTDDFFLVHLGLSTHLPDEPIEWDSEKRLFVSPYHGEAFDIRGDVVRGPANGPLIRCPFELRRDVLWLDVPPELPDEKIGDYCRRWTRSLSRRGFP